MATERAGKKGLPRGTTWAVGLLLLAAAGPVAAQQQASGNDGAAAQDDPLDELIGSLPAEESTSPAEPQPEPEAPAGSAELPTIPVARKEEPVPQLAPQAPRHAQIEEIVVTATKREQALRDIPQSISALSGEDLERSGAQGVEDVARRVPGVTFSADPSNASKVTIRGISTTTLGNPTTGVLFGDVSFTDVYLPRVTLDPNPFDLQTVEVLKGPQGTLFGSSALNGAVRYVPQPPKFGEFEARWFAQYAMVEQGGAAPTYGAAVNIPWGEELAFRAMAFKRDSPGWIDNTRLDDEDVNNLDQQGARGILGWRPNERWDVRFTYLWQQTNANDPAYVTERDGELSRNDTRQPSYADSEYQLADLVLRYSFDHFDLVSDTAWVTKQANKLNDISTDFFGPFGPRVLATDASDSESWSQEIRLVSNDSDSAWRWAAGVVGSKHDLYFEPEYQMPLAPGFDLPGLLAGLGLSNQLTEGLLGPGTSLSLLHVVTDGKVEEAALFGDLTRRIGDSVELSLGGRYYRFRMDGHVLQDGLLVLPQGRPQVEIDDVFKESGFSPKASLLWHASDTWMFYTAVSRGFRNGGVQAGFTSVLSGKQAPSQFKSDTLWNYELGTRTQWLDNSLHVDATLFYIDWKDPQILLSDTAIGVPYLDNVGRVKSSGVEASIQWLPSILPGLMISSSGAWVKTETASPFVGETGADIPEGTPWPYSARWQTATTVAWGGELGNWKGGAGVTHSWLSDAQANLERTQPLFGFQQWDAQLMLANTALRWLPEFSLVVSNFTDERGVTAVQAGGLVPIEKVTYSQPRTILLRLSGSF